MNQSIARRALPVAELFESRLMLSAAPHGHHAIPVGTPVAPLSQSVSGLSGEYFRGSRFGKEVLTRTDSAVDFDWGAGTPDASIPKHPFSVRWVGQITAQYSETYTFSTMSDDGVRLWVGDKRIINDWHEHGDRQRSGSITLQAGQTYDIRLDYYENTVPPANVHLYWSSASQTKQIVPVSALHSAPPASTGAYPGLPAAPADLTAAPASPTQIHLNWSDVPGETGFRVERSPDGSGDWTQIGTTAAGQTQFDDTHVSAGSTWFYRVIATRGPVTSSPSNVASATTPTIVFGLTNDGKVEQIDVSNGSASQVGSISFGTAAGARDPISGKFYYVEQNTNSPRVAVWNPATNTNTTLGTISVSGPVMRAAFRADGTLFITAGSGDLYTINTTTGAATLVGTITTAGAPLASPSGDMSFSPDGTLYLDDAGALYTVDAQTLAATLIGQDTTIGNVQVAFGSDGLLYGTVGTGGLYVIDTTTGVATPIADTGVYQIGDLTGLLG